MEVHSMDPELRIVQVTRLPRASASVHVIDVLDS